MRLAISKTEAIEQAAHDLIGLPNIWTIADFDALQAAIDERRAWVATLDEPYRSAYTNALDYAQDRLDTDERQAEVDKMISAVKAEMPRPPISVNLAPFAFALALEIAFAQCGGHESERERVGSQLQQSLLRSLKIPRFASPSGFCFGMPRQTRRRR